MKSNHPYCVVIGGSNLDISGTVNKKLIFKDSNTSKISMSPGGVGRNIAENIVLLGNQCFLISAFGDDNFGQYIKNSCMKTGVDLSPSITIKNGKTALYISVHEKNGEMILALNDTSIINNITPNHLEHYRQLITSSSVIIIDTNLSEETINYIFKNYSKKNIFVDPVSLSKSSKLSPHLRFIHTLKPNLLEAKLLADINDESDNKLIPSIFSSIPIFKKLQMVGKISTERTKLSIILGLIELFRNNSGILSLGSYSV